MRLLTPVLLGAALLAAAACGDSGAQDEDERLATLVRGVVVAALAGDAGRVDSFIGALPEGLPVEPPLYPDATLIGSTRRVGAPAFGGPEDEPEDGEHLALYFIVLDTADSRQRVFDFYEDALDDGPWRLDASASVRETDRLDFSNVDDLDISGIVQIVPGVDGGRTSVFISLQDAGARLATATPLGTGTPVEPPLPAGRQANGPSVPIPERFPEDIPIPSDAVVTSTAFQRAPTSESFLLVYLTVDLPEDVVAFYEEAFEELGWTFEAGDPIGSERRLRFDARPERSRRDGTGALEGEVIVERSAEEPRLTEVDVRVRAQTDVGPTPTPP